MKLISVDWTLSVCVVVVCCGLGVLQDSIIEIENSARWSNKSQRVGKQISFAPFVPRSSLHEYLCFLGYYLNKIANNQISD